MTIFSFKNFVHKNCHYFGVGDSKKLDGFYTCWSELDLDILGFRLSDGLLQYLLIVFELPVARPTLFRPEVLSVILWLLPALGTPETDDRRFERLGLVQFSNSESHSQSEQPFINEPIRKEESFWKSAWGNSLVGASLSRPTRFEKDEFEPNRANASIFGTSGSPRLLWDTDRSKILEISIRNVEIFGNFKKMMTVSRKIPWKSH